MKFCVGCGHEFEEAENFCPRCGQKREISSLEVKPSSSAKIRAEEGKSNEVQSNVGAVANPKKSKKRAGIIVLVVVLLLAIGGFVLWKVGAFDSLFGKNSETGSEQTGTTQNGSDVAGTDTEESGESDIITGDGTLKQEVKETIYMIHNANLEEKSVTAKITAKESAILVAEIYSEDLSTLLDSQNCSTDNGSEAIEYAVTLSKDVPERYALRVRLTDASGEDLCAPYIDVTHTEAYAQMLAKTADDFPAEKTIVLDGGDNGGFFVIADDVVILKNGENATLSEYDQDSEILVLDSVTEELSAGQKVILLNDGDIEACVTIKGIKKDGSRTKLVGYVNDTLTDYFDFFKLVMDVTDDMADTELSAQNLGAISTADSGEYYVQKLASDNGGIAPVSKGFKYNTEGKLNFAGDMNITGGINGSATITFHAYWDKKFLPDNSYFDMGLSFKTSPVIDLNLGFGKEFDGEYEDEKTAESSWSNGIHISFHKVGYDFGDSKWKWLKKIGDNFKFNSDFALEITGSLSGTVGITVDTNIYVGQGLRVMKGSWGIPYVETYFDHEISDTQMTFNAKAKVEIFAGLKYTGELKLKDLASFSITARAGALASGEVIAQTNPIFASHACSLCCSAEARPVTDLEIAGGIKNSWSIFDKDKDDENVESLSKFTLEVPYDDLTISGYASLVYDPAADGCFEDFPYYFGLDKKTCPNSLEKVSFEAYDKAGKDISVSILAVRSDGLWTADKGSDGGVTTSTKNDYAYFYPGRYTATAEYEGKTVNVEFNVPEDSVVTISFVDDEVKNNGHPVVGLGDDVFYFANTKETYSSTGLLGYFPTNSSAKNSLIKLKGLDSTVLCYPKASGKIYIWNGRIYYSDSSKWYYCSIDGTEEGTASFSNILGASVHPNMLVYKNSSGTVFVENTSGEKKTIGNSANFLGFHDDAAYFSDIDGKKVSFYKYVSEEEDLKLIGSIKITVETNCMGCQGAALFEEDGIYLTVGMMGGTGYFYWRGALVRVDYSEGVDTLIASDSKNALDFESLYILRGEDGSRKLYFGNCGGYSNVGDGYAANISKGVYAIDLETKKITSEDGFTLCEKNGQFLRDGEIVAYLDDTGIPTTILSKSTLDALNYTNFGYSADPCSDSRSLDIIDNYAYVTLRKIAKDDSASMGWRQGYKLCRMGLYRINLEDSSEDILTLYEFVN